MTRPRLLSLCTGFGGLDGAVEDVYGTELVAVSDIDPGACKILAHRYSTVPNLGDVKTIDWDAWTGVEVMTAGYPCQPFSHAGKRAGTDDPRHIFPWIVEGIRRVGPRLVCLENVRGHLRLGFDVVLGALADIGYDARWVCLRASDVGACHKRERLFIAATQRGETSRHSGDSGRTLLPSPRTSDANGSGRHGDGGLDLRTAVELLPTPRATRGGSHAETAVLLPTPRATDGTKGGLLPTPAVNDMGRGKTVEAWDEWIARMKAEHGNGNGHGPSLEIEAMRPTFGKYAAAIARQEAAFGHPAPPPTEPTGRDDAHRLSPRFVEFLMACEPGWVTDVPGLTRNEKLKALGNGVVRPQAAAAFRWLAHVQGRAA